MTTFDMALVLEGGGMRGVFTSGVLDYFMDQQIEFPYAVGVSAGASTGSSYKSKQRGRSKYSQIDLQKSKPYLGWKTLIRKGSFIDLKMLFGEFATRIYPFDTNRFFANPNRFEMVTTNCLTGEANYFEEKQDRERLLLIGEASCSLPYVCPIIYIDQIPMLDGGIADSIPLNRALGQGYSKVLIVLTRNKGYRKPSKRTRLPWFIYSRFPELREQLATRNLRYNRQMEVIEKMEEEGLVEVIRPIRPIEVKRLDKNTERMDRLYQEGYQCAKVWHEKTNR